MDKIIQHIKAIGVKETFKPIIISDIDGVLVRGKTPIAGSLQAMRKVKENNIPFACLTNGGGRLESVKAKSMNQIFGEDLFSAEYMFMNHTPMRDLLLKNSAKEGILLVSGSVDIKSILNDAQIRNYVTADEIYTLLNPNQHEKDVDPEKFYVNPVKKQEVVDELRDRFKKWRIYDNYKDWAKKINSIFSLNDIQPYDTTLQVIHNVLKQRKLMFLHMPPYYASQNDIVWAGGYHRPRLAFGPFNYMLQQHCKIHGFDYNAKYYGKPFLVAFKFVEDYMLKRFKEGTFFMVGDNPRADIQGANIIGWGSFLTQTGVHEGPNNDKMNPATAVVTNFQEAVQIILKIQKDKLYL